MNAAVPAPEKVTAVVQPAGGVGVATVPTPRRTPTTKSPEATLALVVTLGVADVVVATWAPYPAGVQPKAPAATTDVVELLTALPVTVPEVPYGISCAPQSPGAAAALGEAYAAIPEMPEVPLPSEVKLLDSESPTVGGPKVVELTKAAAIIG